MRFRPVLEGAARHCVNVALALALAAQMSPTWAQVSIHAPAPAPAPAPASASAKGGEVFNSIAPAPAREPEITPQVAAWLRQVNAIRANGAVCGPQRAEPAPPLRWSAHLERAALLHSQDQARRNTLTHEGGDGSDVSTRIQRQGYAMVSAGENAAAGHRDVEGAIGGWLRSPGHCANMMNSTYTEVGIAGAPASGTYGAYYTMVLARPGQGPAMPARADLNSRDPQAALAAINAVRATGGSCGNKRFLPAPPLAWDDGLASVARWNALDAMRRRAADDPGNDAARLAAVHFNASQFHELAGSGGPTPAPIVLRFLANPSMCEELLSDQFTHLAVAGVPLTAASNESWWMVLLARRSR